jgi:DNA ligase 1
MPRPELGPIASGDSLKMKEMRAFAKLYTALDETNKTSGKVAEMVGYFRTAPPEDAVWGLYFLTGRRPRRPVTTTQLWEWAMQQSGLPSWLFSECYDAVGDLAETIAKALPDAPHELGHGLDIPLHLWITQRLLPLASMNEEEQREEVTKAWRELDAVGRFVYNKLITGEFRVGVSQDLVVRALSQVSGVPAPVVAHRLMGSWEPTGEFFTNLLAEDFSDANVSRPYPFCLAHALEGDPSSLGSEADWHAEWKWDGIRAQVVHRNDQTFIWSRGEDLISHRFPEIVNLGPLMPNGTVADGEVMAWRDERPLPFAELQKRIGRKTVSKKLIDEVPVVLVAYDLLEWEGEDVRERRLEERRKLLHQLVEHVQREHRGLLPDEALRPALRVSPQIEFSSWGQLAQMRQDSRSLNVEGMMLKHCDSPYLVGRKKGYWWKWKIDPYTVDAVLIYAARGSGKRASLYTDYTFGVWEAGRLVPFAKAYSGLTDEEIREVDAFVRRNTSEKFGPVRTVKPELVFELAFEGIQSSSRHKSGIAVRFPRISRWRKDKPAEEADTLDNVKALLNAQR